jgi:hypothetical protein
MNISEVILTVSCLVLPLAQFRLYYALYVYPLPKAVARDDKLLVVLIVIDRTLELDDLEITSYIYSYFTTEIESYAHSVIWHCLPPIEQFDTV